MPADYSSTAEALSVPLIPEPDESESPSHQSTRPPWGRPRTSLSRNRRRSSLFSLPTPQAATRIRDGTVDRVGWSYRRAVHTFSKLTLLQKIGAILAATVATVVGIGFIIVSGKIFDWLKPVAATWENSVLAYFILWVVVFMVSFPPLVGWAGSGTVAGYLFGVWKGWLIFSTATIVGSTCSFILSRTVLSKLVHRLMKYDKRFTALSLTIKHDGLKLLCMIRLSPLPYSICNGAMSTFPSVHPLMYGLATAIITPKLLVTTFVGSRLRVLAEDGGEMSAGSKAINIISIILSISVGIFTAWYIYRRTLKRAAQLEAQEQANLRASTQPMPSSLVSPDAFADDPDTAARDEEEAVGFNDPLAGDVDDDNIALDPDGYRDEFTDNESDVFAEGDGDGIEETYTLHRHVGSK